MNGLQTDEAAKLRRQNLMRVGNDLLRRCLERSYAQSVPELLRRLVATTEAERGEDGTDTLPYRSPVARLSTWFTLTEGSANQTLHIAHGAS
jgi:hypothetical protein